MTQAARSICLNQYDEPVQVVLREMCRRVGQDPEKLDFGPKENPKDEWYNKASWTSQEEDEFIDWFVGHLYHDAKARKAFNVIGKSLAACKKKSVWMRFYCWNIKGNYDLDI